MTEEEIIKKTIDFCAEIAERGISTEETLYGKEAIEKLRTNYKAVTEYILNAPDTNDTIIVRTYDPS